MIFETFKMLETFNSRTIYFTTNYEKTTIYLIQMVPKMSYKQEVRWVPRVQSSWSSKTENGVLLWFHKLCRDMVRRNKYIWQHCAVILTRFHSALGIILLRSATEAKHKHQNKYHVLQPTYVNRKWISILIGHSYYQKNFFF